MGSTNKNYKISSIKIPSSIVESIDYLIEQNMYLNRGEFVRIAITNYLRHNLQLQSKKNQKILPNRYKMRNLKSFIGGKA
jgi:metal-responsive CopG/Arc/MetJ family transcriptional regulator